MALVDSVDYPNKRIYLGADSVGINLDTLDVYREVRAMRRTNVADRRYYRIIEAGGNIQKTATTFTPAYVQLLQGARLVPFDVSQNLCICRETFTDDGFQGKDVFDRTTLSPTTNVNIDVDVKEVEIRLVETGVSGLTAAESADLALIDTVNTLLETVKDLIEADEVHTGTTVKKLLKGTATELLSKNHSGTPLIDFEARE